MFLEKIFFYKKICYFNQGLFICKTIFSPWCDNSKVKIGKNSFRLLPVAFFCLFQLHCVRLLLVHVWARQWDAWGVAADFAIESGYDPQAHNPCSCSSPYSGGSYRADSFSHLYDVLPTRNDCKAECIYQKAASFCRPQLEQCFLWKAFNETILILKTLNI